MIEAETGRRLRGDGLPVLSDQMAIGKFQSQPVGRRVYIRLDDHLKPNLFGELEHEIELIEVILAGSGLAGSPFHPGPDGVEAECFNLEQILAPGLRGISRDRLQHGGAGLASGVPDGDGKEAFTCRQKRRSQERHANQKSFHIEDTNAHESTRI